MAFNFRGASSLKERERETEGEIKHYRLGAVLPLSLFMCDGE